jgi:large subunit ribosomal protein L21
METLENYAVIKTGGKQYVVSPGDILSIEQLEGEKGSKIVFNEVLLVKSAAQNCVIGAPLVSGAKVEATILAQTKAKKVMIFKKRRRKGYTKKQGHRQLQTKVRIEAIA